MKILFSRRKVMKYEKIFKTKKEEKAFTLIELLLTITILTILALISMPLVYKDYATNAKWAEAYTLLGTIKSAEMTYFSEYGIFYTTPKMSSDDPVLGINSNNNKYFKSFFTYTKTSGTTINPQNTFYVDLGVPTELRTTDVSKWVYSTKYSLNATTWSGWQYTTGL